MFTDFDDESFQPAGTQHLVCGAIPASFGAPVYLTGAAQQTNEYLRRLLRNFPVLPGGLRTVRSLEEAGLRPLNLLRPDGYLLGPAEKVFISRDGTLKSSRTSDWVETETVYRPAPVYDAAQAIAFHEAPDAEQSEADRRSAINWAQDALDDPHTVILAVNAIGSLAPMTHPLSRAVPWEIALTSARGRKTWHQLINPEWDSDSLQKVDLHGATLTDIESAPSFRAIHEELLAKLAGKRVITYGRNMHYTALYSALEYAWLGDALPEGAIWPDTMQTLRDLERTRWECARLRHAEYENHWDPATQHYALPPLLPPTNALAQCKAAADTLQRMATPALRYAELNARAEQASHEGKSHNRRALVGTRLSRITASRQAVLERSQGACENPDCPDPRYTMVRGKNGTFLLEVDHIDDHAKGGEDLPRSMIALCPNCHAIKTRTAVTEEFRASLHATALARHHHMLGSTPL
ncbi:HNH endonuclease [Streptomyces avermitilis]|uniref:HNH endonuclease n=1 Tax=Streptomyces avermitilis TaxID=33903 RepID=UPI00380024D6